MPLEPVLLSHLERLLVVVDESGARGNRLVDNGRRLWAMVQKLMAMALVRGEIDRDAIQLACFAMQLPARHRPSTPPRTGQTALRDRCEQSAELLLECCADLAPADLLDRTARILRQTPGHAPAAGEARLLADAINLEDFGLIGLLSQTIYLAHSGAGIAQLVEGFEKREQYGYWDARLKDSFHFDAVRDLARDRLKSARRAVAMLRQEMQGPSL